MKQFCTWFCARYGQYKSRSSHNRLYLNSRCVISAGSSCPLRRAHKINAGNIWVRCATYTNLLSSSSIVCAMGQWLRSEECAVIACSVMCRWCDVFPPQWMDVSVSHYKTLARFDPFPGDVSSRSLNSWVVCNPSIWQRQQWPDGRP